MPYEYSDHLETVGGVPTLTRVYNDGSTQTMTGYEALANDGSSKAAEGWRRHNPRTTYLNKRYDRPGDKSMWHTAGEYASSAGNGVNSTFVGNILDKGLIPGAALGGATGLLGGLAANWLASAIFGAKNPHFGMIGGIGGALLGGLIGHERTVKNASFQHNLEKAAATYNADDARTREIATELYNSPEGKAMNADEFTEEVRRRYNARYGGEAAISTEDTGVEKEATMYKDPRNFVLEKLRMASDISMMEKAQLAARVRNMDPVQASRLADAVRASLGFGVGALVAKFLGRSALSGGFAGLLGMALLGTVAKKNGLF